MGGAFKTKLILSVFLCDKGVFRIITTLLYSLNQFDYKLQLDPSTMLYWNLDLSNANRSLTETSKQTSQSCDVSARPTASPLDIVLPLTFLPVLYFVR